MLISAFSTIGNIFWNAALGLLIFALLKLSENKVPYQCPPVNYQPPINNPTEKE